jgi:hypothetical protein
MKHKLTWFTDRIGKRIFRNKTSCKCETCKDVFENGLVVGDQFHAEYLEMVQHDLNINYYDKPVR